MTRLLVALIALVCATAASAQNLPAASNSANAVNLPAGLDPQNTILLDTAYGRVVIKLRAEFA